MKNNYSLITKEIYKLCHIIPWDIVKDNIIPYIIYKNIIICSSCKTIMQTYQQKINKSPISWTIKFNNNSSEIKCFECFKTI